MEKEIPVFLFNGFLDSGKTTLIKEIIEQEPAYHDYNTLIIATEDGEVEYDDAWKNEYKVYVETILDDEYRDELFFYELYKKYRPNQIVIELNSFVNFNEFRLPRSFAIYQEITLFDAGKFELYYNNLKPMINQMLEYSTLVVFNRCNETHNLGKFRRNIRSFNQRCEVAFENSEGKLTTILNEDLPYDISKKVINLADEDFPIWYLDITECFDKYEGKTINFNAYVRGINDRTIVVGRQIMTCCEDDIQFYGFECFTDKKIGIDSFVSISCTPIKCYSEIANANVIMLKAVRVKELEYKKEEFLEFK